MLRFTVLILSFSLVLHAVSFCPKILSNIAKYATTWSTPPEFKNFRQAEYKKYLALYSKKRGKILTESDQPLTTEQKLAFLDAFRPDTLQLSLSSLSKVQKKEMVKILSQMDFKEGFTKNKLQKFFIETYRLAHPTASSLIERWRLGEEAYLQQHIEERFIEEFSKNGLFEAAKRFGIILPETNKEKYFNWIASYFQKETKIPPSLILSILKKGFNKKNYASFEKIVGKSERTKSLWNHVKSSLGWSLFGLICYQDFRQQEDDQKSQSDEVSEEIGSVVEEAKQLAKEIMAALPEDVNLKEQWLADWLKEYIDKNGLPPQEGTSDFKEYEELKALFTKKTKP